MVQLDHTNLDALLDVEGRVSLDLHDGAHYEGYILDIVDGALIFGPGGPMAPEEPARIPADLVDPDTLFVFSDADRAWKKLRWSPATGWTAEP